MPKQDKLKIGGFAIAVIVMLIAAVSYAADFVNAKRELEHRLTKTETQIEGLDKKLDRMESKIDRILEIR